ncbi:glutamate--tRNA ligase [Deinococcus radiophilus]|uniref:Glutamate--tRNA ligase n=1 Tax=Deinococcus radiophilus TaxID=32062 RepID=A0A3S0IP06_9DEIO|nr:glutamate--tRNA ligase [Deinococcus radiophilus]RTR28322.1 glutamate--tRNA ligase [Deinococcus radiophilus]UFA51186.1 glutamate--tRNA ligase [Deinococcus radiophilus]
MTDQAAITRIAPSPTGDPHVGTAYQALFNSVFARQHGGKFIVRIEDTDRSRYNAQSETRILDMLDWLGIQPDASPRREDDKGPYTQSQRAELHRRYAQQLLDSGAAYRAFDTPEELEERRQAAEARKDSYLGYDRRDRELTREESDCRAAAGEEFVIRLKAPLDGQTVVKDRLRGDVVFDNAQLDDKVLLKRDGFPTYHLAAMVDDHLMGVTHVIRAEEWLTSTPIHQLILSGLGWEQPEWIHTPWLLSAGGKKYSKRRGDPSVEDFRRMGIVPEALLNYLGMMGWTMPNGEEVFSVDDMVREFSWDRVSLGGSTFDQTKLKWLNGKYLREVLSEAKVVERVKTHLNEFGDGLPTHDDAYFAAVVRLMIPRLETLGDFGPMTGYFWNEDYAVDDKAAKALEQGAELLPGLLTALERVQEWNAESVKVALHEYAEAQELKLGKVMPPVRAAVAGTMQSPDLGELLEVLGRERVLARVSQAVG